MLTPAAIRPAMHLTRGLARQRDAVPFLPWWEPTITPTWSETFRTLADWTPTNITATTDGSGIRLRGNGAATGAIDKTLSPTVNMSGLHFDFDFTLFDEAGDSAYSNINYVNLRFMDALGNWRDYYVTYTPGLNYDAMLGSNHLSGTLDDYNTLGGSGSLAAVKYVRVLMQCSGATKTPSIRLDRLRLFANPLAYGVAFIVFDSPHAEAAPGLDYLLSLGLTATIAWGAAPGMAVEDILDYADQGIAIIGYPSSISPWYSYTTAQHRTAIRERVSYLAGQGHHAYSSCMATPGSGRTRADVDAGMYGRWIGAQTSTYSVSGQHRIGSFTDYRVLPLCGGTGTEDRLPRLAALAASGGSGVFVFHGFDGVGQCTLAAFQTFADALATYVAAGTVHCCTVPQRCLVTM